MKLHSSPLTRCAASIWLSILFLFAASSTVFGLAFDFNGDLRWTGGVVPYVIDSNVSSENLAMIRQAMRTWQKAANINFVKRTTEADYVKIAYTFLHDVNFSFVAKCGGEQPMWINNWSVRTVTHEMGHTLGCCHEHQRSDRDNYVTISGYIPGTDINYTKLDGGFFAFGALSDNRTPYDYFSIMHYDAKGFNLPWVENVMVPKYATVIDDPTGNLMATNFETSFELIKVIGVDFTDLEDLSIRDKEGIVSEYGTPGSLSGTIVGDGRTVNSGNPATMPTGIKIQLAGTGKTAEAARRLSPNPLTVNGPGVSLNYAFAGTPTGTYTITPSKAGYYFTPRSRTVTPANGTDINFIISQIETNPPTLYISGTDGDSYQTAPNVTGGASDTGSGVAQVRIALFRDRDGVWYNFLAGTWGTENFSFSQNMAIATGTAIWSYQLPTLTDGSYSVYAQAVDAQNNGSDPWESRSFSIDNVAPKVTLFVPASETPYNVAPQAQGVASDEDSTVREVRVAIFNEADSKWWNWNLNNWGNTTFDFVTHVRLATNLPNWRANLPNLSAGNYQIHVQSVDTADNGSEWEYSRFSIDQTPPMVAFTGFTNQQHIFNFTQLVGSISEPGTVTFRITEFNIGGTNRYWNAYNWVTNNDTTVENPTILTGLNWSPAYYAPLPTRGQTRTGFYIVDITGKDIAGNITTTNIVLYRTAPDTTPPELSFFTPVEDQVFTNNSLPFFGGISSDPESELAAVDLYLYRMVAPGQYQYWNGTAWVSYSTNLVTAHNNSIWSAPSGYSFPSGANLSNGVYSIQLSARNNEVPAATRSISVNFSVDYHPVYVWTAGSYTDQISGNENQRWDNPANWDVGGVPPDSAVVIINNGSPDSTAMGIFDIYGVNLSGGNLSTAGMNVRKLNLTGGQLTGAPITIPTNGTFNISGATDKALTQGTVIDNNGTTLWTGAGFLYGGYGTVLNNNGTFRVQNDSQLYNNTGNIPLPTFNNYGTFQKTVATNVTSISSANGGWVFNHYGTLDVQTGIVSFQGQANIQHGSIFSGAGLTRIDSGTTTAFGTNNLAGGNVELAGGTLVGTNQFSGSGTFSWSGGTVDGRNSIGATANLLIKGDGSKSLTGWFSNSGTGVWIGNGDVNCRFSSRFDNSGAFTALNNAQFYNNSGGIPLPVFFNTGTFTKSSGTNSTVFSDANGGVSFYNFGAIDVQSGVLALGGGGTNSNASFNTATGTRVDIFGGTHTWTGGITCSGSGRTRMTGGAIILGGGTNTINSGGTFEVAGGALDGTGGLSGSGTFDWSGGSIVGTLGVGANLTFAISGTTDKTLIGTINNSGTALWTGTGSIYGRSGSALNNTGTFQIQNDSQFYNNSGGAPVPIFNNLGTIRKSVATGLTVVSSANGGWTFNNSGLIDIQTGVLSSQTQLNLNNGGSFSGSGTTRVDIATATMNGSNNIVAGGTLELAGGALNGVGNFHGAGTFAWTGGTITGTNGVGTNGNLAITGANPKTLVGVLNHAGAGVWLGTGSLNCSAGSRFNNSGTFVAQNSVQAFNYSGGGPAFFNNTGTFTKNGDTNRTEFLVNNSGVAFNNTGTVIAQTGVLALGGGGTSSNATFTANGSARIEFPSGDSYFNGGLNFTGTGITRVNGAGITSLGGTNSIASNATFDIAAGVLAGFGGFAGPGTFSWTGGNIAGTLNLQPSLTFVLSGSADKTLGGGTLNNAGAIIWTGVGSLYGGFSSVINNAGTFDIQNDSQFYNYSGGIQTFNNTGTLRKTVATGETIIQPSNGGWTFNNAGLIDIQTGVLSSRSQLNLNAGGSYSGAGSTRNDGGTATINGTSSILSSGSFEQAGGTFNGTGLFNGPGSFAWSGGTFAAVLTIDPATGLLMAGNTDRSFTGILNNGGTATWTNNATIYVANGSIFNNSGTFLAQNEGQFYNNTGGVPLFNNSGTFRKTVNTTTTFANVNGGINFTNSGTIDLRAGNLAINAGYLPSSASRLKFVLSGTTPAAQFGRELFPGNAPLTGILEVVLANGFIPTNGTSFDIVGYSSHSGQFTSTQLPALPFGSTWKVEYNAGAVTLKVAPPFVISAPAKLGNGHFQMSFTGPSSSSAIFETSTNLIQWVPIATNAPFNGTFVFDDAQAASYSNRFYHILITP
ncbi:MAG: hypothetical protein JWM68_1999 [Verrucomicrobiales bacterium]|nr:hypothetical protein [Verrucomicrobiales bacterium]